MTPEQFCYWLQGRAEMQPDTPPTAQEWAMIAQHLATVFRKVTPQLGDPLMPARFMHPAVLPASPIPPFTVTCQSPATSYC